MLQRIVVIFRNDDPSALSDVEHERRVAAIFRSYGVPQVLGVIPNCCAEGFRVPNGTRNVPLAANPAMVDFLRRAVLSDEYEIALHGYTHRTNHLSRPRRREFFEFRGVGLRIQCVWMREGAEMIERILGIRPISFIPPWNRLDDDTLLACRENGFSIISAGAHTPTVDGLIPVGTDCCLERFPGRLRHAMSATAPAVFLRVLFHSRSARSDAELAALERAVRLATQAPGCQVLTLRQAAERFGAELVEANAAAAMLVDPTELPGTRRARAAVYRRAGHAVGLFQPHDVTLRQAEELYWSGLYTQTNRLNRLAELNARGVLFGGRLVALAVGLAFGATITLLASTMTPTAQSWIWAAAALITVLSSAGLFWRATARDTRTELMMACVFAILGGAVAVTSIELLRA